MKMSPLIAMNPPTHLSVFNFNSNLLVGYIYNSKRKYFFQSKLNVSSHTHCFIYIYMNICTICTIVRNDLVYILCTIVETN